MKTYKLIVAYDGTHYCGWQFQKEKPSVVQVLNNTFLSAFKKKVKVLGASRTDAGVHAAGQVVKVVTDLPILPAKLQWAWNNALPPDIKIRRLELVDDSFNPFHNVEQKIYFYHFFLERPLPFLHHYGYFYPYTINIEDLSRALQLFVGTHDFASFRSIEDTREDTVRTIDSISLEYIKRYNVYRVTVKGQKFLRHMIRRIVGASLSAVTKHKDYKQIICKVLEAKNPSHDLANAPAKGLMLYKIIYF